MGAFHVGVLESRVGHLALRPVFQQTITVQIGEIAPLHGGPQIGVNLLNEGEVPGPVVEVLQQGWKVERTEVGRDPVTGRAHLMPDLPGQGVGARLLLLIAQDHAKDFSRVIEIAHTDRAMKDAEGIAGEVEVVGGETRKVT